MSVDPAAGIRVGLASSAAAAVLLVAVSGSWYAAGWIVFVVGAVVYSWLVLASLLKTRFGFEKSHQAVLHLLPRLPVAMVVFGGVLLGGPWYGLPGQLLAALAGSTEAWLWVGAKALIVFGGGTTLWYTTVSKGSRL